MKQTFPMKPPVNELKKLRQRVQQLERALIPFAKEYTEGWSEAAENYQLAVTRHNYSGRFDPHVTRIRVKDLARAHKLVAKA